MLSMLISMSMSMSTTIGDITGAGTVSVGDADGASTVTAYVVVLLVGFVRVVVVDFLKFSIFVVVGLVRNRVWTARRYRRSVVIGAASSAHRYRAEELSHTNDDTSQ